MTILPLRPGFADRGGGVTSTQILAVSSQTPFYRALAAGLAVTGPGGDAVLLVVSEPVPG